MLIGPILQVDVGLFWHKKIGLAKILLVRIKFLLEKWSVTSSVLFAHVSHLGLVLVLQLGLLVAEILLLRLNNDMELGFLTFDLLDKLLEVGDLLEVLYLLRGYFLIEQVLLFLVSDLVFQLSLAHKNSF